MSALSDPLFSGQSPSAWVRQRTLITLRWLAVMGQSLAVITATLLMGIDLRLDLCALLIGLSAAFNIGAMLIQPATKRLSPRDAMLTLLFDLAQLAALLYLTGGLNNPFAVLIVAPTVISATVLRLEATLLIGMITLFMITMLIWYNIPLHTMSGRVLEMPGVLVYGMWMSLVIAVTFLSIYARRVTMETFSMSRALNATQLALEREQKLTALGGVVAAAAHELGTPLATIKLVATELADELADKPTLQEDAQLINSQADRCRDILRDMGQMGKDDLHLRHAPLIAVVSEAAEPHMDRGKVVILRIDGTPIDDSVAEMQANQPEITRHPEIIHGLRNLVQNAVDFAYSTVWIDVFWSDTVLRVTVGDDGQGFPADLIGRLGDPFVRRRNRERRTEAARPGYEGMGLGLFIAKTLLERSGAHLTFANGSAPLATHRARVDGPVEFARPLGAVVELEWPRETLEVARTTTRGPLGLNQMFTS